jgi:hypothetical protein
VEHSEGKGGERAMDILRFQGGSPPPVSIKDHRHFGPGGQALIYTDYMSGVIGPDKLSSFITTLSNRPSLIQGGYVEGE